MTDNELLMELKRDVAELSNILYDMVTGSKENIWPDIDDYYRVVGLLNDISSRCTGDDFK